MDSVWLVTGETGEYDDRTDWYVCVFPTEAEAQSYVTRLRNWCRNNRVRLKGNPGADNVLSGGTEIDGIPDCPLDPWIRVDYTGVDWLVVEVPVGEEGMRLMDGRRRLGDKTA